MNNTVKYGLIAVVVVAIFLFTQLGDRGGASNQATAGEIDLNNVLEVTSNTLQNYQQGLTESERNDPDAVIAGFAEALEKDYNTNIPALYSGTIGVAAQDDASLLAYNDSNADHKMETGEEALFKIEIDGEQARLIATSRTGEVNERHFSGTSLLAGYLIGSMLSRQRAAGVNPNQLASKKPVSAQSSARARAGSGSHSRGK